MSDTTRDNDVTSSKTGVPKPVSDDAQANAAERVREGTPAPAHPIVERQEGSEQRPK
jgi:hypothetical protein